MTAKIIDLGLAKAVHEPGGQSAVSTPGVFVGTPDFASPGQFAGLQVDIRSDLYSLGATLWKMLTGHTPFRGTSAELMHQHLHAPVPLEQLEGFPQPVVKGYEEELRSASDEFGGHCLALTLLGSYLTDAYNGDIRFRKEVSKHLAYDVRQGAHARKVMESYQTWLGEGPELSVLRMLGLFDRPADEKALGALMKPPAIRGLTESLTDLRPIEWQMILARLRRARLLAGEDPHSPGQLDTHPLIREYFGEQLRSQRTEAWKECNRRLFHYYQALAPPLPDSFRDMEPLFLAVISGCNAGLYHQTLHKVYIPRIQRGDGFFAPTVLGARGALLSVLARFFEQGRWEALSAWHLEAIASCQATVTEAISLAKKLNDMHALAVALWNAGTLAQFERDSAGVERLSSDLIVLSGACGRILGVSDPLVYPDSRGHLRLTPAPSRFLNCPNFFSGGSHSA